MPEHPRRIDDQLVQRLSEHPRILAVINIIPREPGRRLALHPWEPTLLEKPDGHEARRRIEVLIRPVNLARPGSIAIVSRRALVLDEHHAKARVHGERDLVEVEYLETEVGSATIAGLDLHAKEVTHRSEAR